MLIFKKFNHVSVIRTYGILLKWDFLVLKLCYVCSYKLIRDDKKIQRKSKYTSTYERILYTDNNFDKIIPTM